MSFTEPQNTAFQFISLGLNNYYMLDGPDLMFLHKDFWQQSSKSKPPGVKFN